MVVEINNYEKTLQQTRSGLTWLTEECEYLMNNLNTPIERWEVFWDRMILVDSLDRLVRKIHGFSGCIWNDKRCPLYQPFLCCYCVEQKEKQ